MSQEILRHNIPVQVDGRIVDCVDTCHAESMGRAPNVQLVRRRKSNQIVRVIVEATVQGKGDVDVASSHMDSRRAHKREVLFNTDDAPLGEIKGMPFVFVPKHIPQIPLGSSDAPRRRDATNSRRKRKQK